MSKKTTGFDLMSNFKDMSTCALFLHKLSFRELCTSCVKAQSYFKEQPVCRCEVQEMRRLNYFFETFYTLFYKNKCLGFGKKLRIN